MNKPTAVNFKAKKHFFSIALALNLCCPQFAYAQTDDSKLWSKNDDGQIFNAFEDELKRTIGNLKLGEHPTPYFASFTGKQSKFINVYGAFGALDRTDRSNGRNLSVDVRVGDYKFDSSGSSGSYFSSPYDAYYGDRMMSLDDDYDSIRRALWLQCDSKYKRAIEDLEKKKAVLRQKKVDNLPDSFMKVEPVVSVLPVVSQNVDASRWETIVRTVSREFRSNPAIVDCRVVYENRDDIRWFLNSEGSKNREQEFNSYIYMNATAQAKDGMRVSDFALFATRHDKDLPSMEELLAAARKLSDNVVKLSHAPLIEEYNGPILFEKQAAAEFFAQTLAPHLVVSQESAFERRNKKSEADMLGKRILPKFINIVDNPLVDNFHGKPLKCNYVVDDEGVKAKTISLVEHGTLKTLCSGRTPSKGIRESNGHFREGKAKTSQLFITSDESKSPEELRKQLIQIGKDTGLSHVMIARKIVNPAVMGMDIESSLSAIFSFMGSSRRDIDIAPPTLLYRVSVADGSEELVRGARFSGLTRRTWRDIESTANDDDVYITTHGFSSISNLHNIVTPSILLSEVDIVRASQETDIPIVLERPDLAIKSDAPSSISPKKTKKKNTRNANSK